ncbi:MAG TPA: DsbA family protein [Anaeromyxobacteraceae bacterium]|nr:DsbA family protein [Anaeromyxobacteraceae bacterium]
MLARCAAAAGLDPAATLAAVHDPAIAERVDAMGREAARVGVSGIPTFLNGGDWVIGCQP